MADLAKVPDEMRADFEKALAEMPEPVRDVARRLPPWKLYRMKSTTHRVVICCYEEHADDSVTLRVHVSSDYNLLFQDREVFGVDPNDLEECDLPGPEEIVGIIPVAVLQDPATKPEKPN